MKLISHGHPCVSSLILNSSHCNHPGDDLAMDDDDLADVVTNDDYQDDTNTNKCCSERLWTKNVDDVLTNCSNRFINSSHSGLWHNAQ